MKRLGLIGFSGCGKSSLLKLAEKDSFVCADTDFLMEKGGADIEKMLLEGREEDFRMCEANAIRSVLESDCDFVAFGGGVHFGHPAWKDVCGSDMKLVYLRSSFEDLSGRFEERPLYKKLGAAAYRKLFEERCPLYEKAAGFVVDTDGRGLNEIWIEVKEIWNYLFR